MVAADSSSTHTLITLVNRFAAGDESVLPELTPSLYAELRRIAQSHLRKEAPGHTLQATGWCTRPTPDCAKEFKFAWKATSISCVWPHA